MKGILVILLVGGAATLLSLRSPSELAQAWAPLLALCTGMGVLTAWLVATDDYDRPRTAASRPRRAA